MMRKLTYFKFSTSNYVGFSEEYCEVAPSNYNYFLAQVCNFVLCMPSAFLYGTYRKGTILLLQHKLL